MSLLFSFSPFLLFFLFFSAWSGTNTMFTTVDTIALVINRVMRGTDMREQT